VSPFGDERLDRLVLTEAARLLGVERLDVRERWQGVYPSAPGDPFMVAERLPGVWVVEVVSGVGMTAGLGLAPRALEQMLAAVTGAPRGAPVAALGGAPPLSVEARADCGP